MRLHEYQARELLRGAGVPVPASDVVTTSDEAVAAYKGIGGQVVVKAQVFAGGRGKAGFVKLCANEGDVKRAAHFMLTNKMVSKQTGPGGIEVKKLLIAAAVDIESEYYVGMVIDRAKNAPV
ncbi:MAG: acetate--CoA ligase family protein, partial [Planctomycetes bacterium]|nr:acetate--CoA ligase family protein [Planctomycetota bacterium]